MSSESKGLDKNTTIVFSNKILNLLNNELIEAIGEDATSELNYEQGKKVGGSFIKESKKNIDLKKIIYYLKKLNYIGYYSGLSAKNTLFKVLQKNKILIVSKTNLSSEKNMRRMPTCSYVLGEVIGFLEALTGEIWKGKEVKCVSLGNEFDEFLIER